MNSLDDKNKDRQFQNNFKFQFQLTIFTSNRFKKNQNNDWKKPYL